MKRALVMSAALGLAFSPLIVTPTQAAPVKHHHVVKHHRKAVKKRVIRHHARRHLKHKTA